jgi:hypothetical protein
MREKQYERTIVLSRLGFSKATDRCGQIVTQCDRPARLKDFNFWTGVRMRL